MIGSIGIARRLGLALAGLVVSACSVGPATSPETPAAPSPSAAVVASPSVAVVASPTIASPSASPSIASPSLGVASSSPRPRPTISADQLSHVDIDLEALLPTRIGDVPLLHLSAAGHDFSGSGDICSFVCPLEPKLMAEGVGASLDDLRLAVAMDPAVEHYLLVAWRVDGATGAELRDARIAMLHSEAPYPLVKDFRVAGRVVTVAVRSWFPNDTQFLVAGGDALIVIQYPTEMHEGADVSLPDGVAEIVAALP